MPATQDSDFGELGLTDRRQSVNTNEVVVGTMTIAARKVGVRSGAKARCVRGGDFDRRVGDGRKLSSPAGRKVSTRRLECDHFGGLGVDSTVGRGGGAEGADR
jgi:hypothetical protein